MKFIKYQSNLRIDFKNIKLHTKPKHSRIDDNVFKKNFSLVLRDGRALGTETDSDVYCFLIDWDNNIYANMLEDLIVDERILMVSRILKHHKFVTNYLEEI